MKKKKKIYKNSLFAILLVFVSLSMCVGYAAFNSVTLNLIGSSNVLSPKKLFISNVIVNENNSSAVINLYDETFLDASITLNGNDATVEMEITVKNNSVYDYAFEQVDYSFGMATYDNENIIFDLEGLSTGDVIESTETLTFNVVFYYKDLTNITNNILNCKLNFNFKNISGMPLNQLILYNEKEPLNNEDGLYSYQDIYYYSGENVNNYIWYNCRDGYNSGNENCEVWRILTIESDGSVKIIKDEPLEQEIIASLETKTNFWYNQTHSSDQYKIKNMISAGKVVYDARRRRPVSQLAEGTSYCIYGSNGCNAFATNTIFGSYSNLIVDADSSIKMYLENLYYEYVLSESAKEFLKINEYNIGIIDITVGKDIDSVYYVEQKIKGTSKVALLNLSNYILASKNINCRENFLGSDCAKNTWLNAQIQYMFLNGKTTDTNAQIFIHDSNGLVTSRDANYELFLKPVITLKPSTIALGSGSVDGDYYNIVS